MALPWKLVYAAAAVAFFVRPMTVGVFLSVLTLWRVLYRLWLYPVFLTPLKHLPTPKTRSWLRGNGLVLWLETPYGPMHGWIRTIQNDGLIRYYVVGNLERVLLTSPKTLAEVLVGKAYQFPKPELVRASLGRVVGRGLLLAEGDEHRLQRRNVQPAFSYRHIKELYPVFWDKSVEMVQRMEQSLAQQAEPTGSNVVRISDWSSRATLDIIGVAGMDYDFQTLRDPDNELSRHYRKMLHNEQSWLARVVVLLGMFVLDLAVVQRLPIKRNRDIDDGARAIRSVARQVIRSKRAKLGGAGGAATDAVAAAAGAARPADVDIISVALRSGSFSEDSLVDQMMTFIGAGHETTSTAVQWAIYALCKHPDVQTRLREEVRSSLPSIAAAVAAAGTGPGRADSVTAAQIDSLPYLSAVCNEVLRFYPSVPVTVRESAQDTTLAGQRIPRGTLIAIVPQIINRSAELWGADADSFDPQRWLDDDGGDDGRRGRANNTGGADSNYAFLTFLHGPRSCVGQAFARAELACLVAALVGRFHMRLLRPDGEVELRHGPTVSPRDGVLACLTVVDGW